MQKKPHITDDQLNQALEVIEAYENQQTHTIRDSIINDCPSQDYEPGTPSGNCDGDGHYQCNGCIHHTPE